ncbi:MAG: RNA polymerase sporulation sigma factor SigK [Acetatifactor sp.]|nr:RNA polymerase sporulation sigma factor SigK [Acetatifactor sp.]
MQPLTPEDEARYVDRMRTGSVEEAREARERLIEHNLRLVAHIVKKYQNVDEDLDDLLSIGSIGLIKAVNTFDAGKGRFATYACRCIDNELLMMLRSRKKREREVSLYEPIGQDKEGNEIRLLDIMEHSQTDVVERMELDNNVRNMLALLERVLTKRERDIIIHRYGLYGEREMTQNEIGEYLGISRSYVSRIEKKALDKLKKGFSL